jgi:hypothetical protein
MSQLIVGSLLPLLMEAIVNGRLSWVECNETQHFDFIGLRYANPAYILAFTTASKERGYCASR